jgi:hypothetical protein
MTRGRPPWYHLWHNWSPWLDAKLEVTIHQVQTAFEHHWNPDIQARYCEHCDRLQLKIKS